MSEQERMDLDAINMVHRGKRFPRAGVHFVPEAEYQRLRAIAAEYPRLKREETILMEHRKKEAVFRENRKQIRAVGGMARGCVALVFLAGAVQGMVAPVFAGVLVLGCVAWGAGHYLGGCRNA